MKKYKIIEIPVKLDSPIVFAPGDSLSIDTKKDETGIVDCEEIIIRFIKEKLPDEVPYY